VPTITGAPFSAEATTEFTQILADGNRIEKRYSTSLARDSKGRTRQEQDVALIGPLALFAPGAGARAARARVDAEIAGQSPRFVTIPESPLPVVQIPIGGDLIHAPTGAVLLQFRRLAIEGVYERVFDYEQPTFAWR